MHWRRSGFILGTLILTFLYTLVPWEWSFIDDSNLRMRAEDFNSQFGLLGGIWESLKYYALNDHGWGIFRPAFWMYESIVYLFSPKIVYSLRFLMLLGMIHTSVEIMSEYESQKRRWLQLFAAVLILSNAALYWGLSFPSLQEYSGCFFATIGLWFALRKHSFWIPVVFYFVAACFKNPFLWLVFAHGIAHLIFDRKNLFSKILVLVVSGSTLLLMFGWARQGSYTSGYSWSHISAIITTLKESLKPLFYLTVFLLSFLLVFRVKFQVRDMTLRDLIVLGWVGAGLIYFLQLLPWSASGYYFMGPYHLISVGLFVFLADRIADYYHHKMKIYLGLTIGISLAVFCVSRGFWKVYSRNAFVVELRDWALNLPLEGRVLAINYPEPADRFYQLMQLRTARRWNNQVKYVVSGQSFPSDLNYYIVMTENKSPIPDSLAVEKLLTWGVILKAQ